MYVAVKTYVVVPVSGIGWVMYPCLLTSSIAISLFGRISFLATRRPRPSSFDCKFKTEGMATHMCELI